MSTPTDLTDFRVTWLSGSGDRVNVHAHRVSAASWAIDRSIDFAVFKDADGGAVFSICAAYLVSVEVVNAAVEG